MPAAGASGYIARVDGTTPISSVTPTSTRAVAGDRGYLGHPRGLYDLAFTEAWERFSFYGMLALLVLYMVDQLLLPGHVEHIAGFAALRTALESFAGPLSPGACYGRMSPSAFGAMHAAIAAAGGVSVLLFRQRLELTLHSRR